MLEESSGKRRRCHRGMLTIVQCHQGTCIPVQMPECCDHPPEEECGHGEEFRKREEKEFRHRREEEFRHRREEEFRRRIVRF